MARPIIKFHQPYVEMIPSPNLRRVREKTFQYEKATFDFDVHDISDLPSRFQENYEFSEFDMALPTSFTGKVLPKDLPQQAFMGNNSIDLKKRNKFV
jgi:hypothetical protein